jgi:hypothetical protein
VVTRQERQRPRGENEMEIIVFMVGVLAGIVLVAILASSGRADLEHKIILQNQEIKELKQKLGR